MAREVMDFKVRVVVEADNIGDAAKHATKAGLRHVLEEHVDPMYPDDRGTKVTWAQIEVVE